MTSKAAPEPEQLVLDLPHRAASGVEDFLVSQSNEAAVGMVDRWPDWAHPALVVSGPERSGKSHLVHVWRLKSGAAVLEAECLGEASIAAAQEAPALAVENIDRGIGEERILFHLMNLARERKRSILLTSRRLPGEIEIALPDLRSRLRAAPLVAIAPPDDALLKAVLVKLFADRQLTIEPHVINHICLHMERSMAAAEQVVVETDRLALALGRRVTRVIAAEVLRQVSQARGEK